MKSQYKKLFAALAAVVGMAAALAGCSGNSPPVGGSAGSSGATSTADLVYGCNWLFESDYQTANFAFPETNAVYWVAAIPDSWPSGDTIQISSTSATARYFSFQVYGEDGAAESSDNDADIFGQSATPAELVASGQSYTVSIISSATATASGTTLVNNSSKTSTRAPAHHWLLYRLYLPTNGADAQANLPVLTYVKSDGTRIPLSQTPDQPSCNQILDNIDAELSGVAGSSSGGSSSSSSGSTTLKPAVKPPSMVAFISTIGTFQNLDVDYMYVESNSTLGDMLILRGKAPVPGVGTGTPQVRYWSICSDTYHKPYAVVQCMDDQEAQLDSGGYYNVIVSVNTPPSGYGSSFNYLPWGKDEFGEPIYRQLLADSSFTQSIKANKLSPLPSLTMGEYYPQATYCSNSVFSSNLASGPSAVFSACKSSEGTGTVADPGVPVPIQSN
jgi:hypothetical protein